jgi:hypothetical protein
MKVISVAVTALTLGTLALSAPTPGPHRQKNEGTGNEVNNKDNDGVIVSGKVGGNVNTGDVDDKRSLELGARHRQKNEGTGNEVNNKDNDGVIVSGKVGGDVSTGDVDDKRSLALGARHRQQNKGNNNEVDDEDNDGVIVNGVVNGNVTVINVNLGDDNDHQYISGNYGPSWDGDGTSDLYILAWGEQY